MKKYVCFVMMTILASVPVMVIGSDNIPTEIHYQGRLQDDGAPYEGNGIFRFALIDDATPDPMILWSNDGTNIGETADNVPVDGVEIPVSGGLFNAALGNDELTNMTPVPVSVFRDHKIVYLRVWFQKPGTAEIELLSPDTQMFAAPFSYRAGSIHGEDIDEKSIPMGKLARESVGPEHEGRSNTIKSVYFRFEDIPVTAPSRLIYDVPEGKTFVLTDIFITSAGPYTSWTFTNHATSQLEERHEFIVDARTESRINWSLSFKAGIPFTAPEVIAVFPDDEDNQNEPGIWGCISGFEFETP